ncbi:MAG: putative baseplate assembly protein, partial [Chloroflexota bacterium]|nr:putative baseplate assembly protein [Chloroflexota bacterium]
MPTQYQCHNQARLNTVRSHTTLNAIDFLEVSADQKVLKVHCVRPLPILTRANVVITGGVRVPAATLANSGQSSDVVIAGRLRVASVTTAGKVLTVTVNTPGDFSTYTLHIITAPGQLQPPPGFDPQLSQLEFSFKVDCAGDFDCAPDTTCPPPRLDEPEINYLAKDYASFRRLMLDRLSVVAPAWQERNAADGHVALVELLAYVGDQLSYYQDAVATEAYLDTAHQRSSIRRHARLLDYPMHDGCNARAWVCFEYEGPGLTVPEGKLLLTRSANESPTLYPADLNDLLQDDLLHSEQPTIFATLHPVTLTPTANEIRFYTWGDAECCLPQGAT